MQSVFFSFVLVYPKVNWPFADLVNKNDQERYCSQHYSHTMMIQDKVEPYIKKQSLRKR